MWKKQGSWNFFHAKLIPNSSIDSRLKDDQMHYVLLDEVQLVSDPVFSKGRSFS